MSPPTRESSPEGSQDGVPAGGRDAHGRRWPKRLAVLLLSLALALALVEVWARTQHPFGIQYYAETNHYLNGSIQIVPEATRPDGRIFENRPTTTLELARFRFATDAAGLRAPEADDTPLPSPRLDQHLRLLFIGDSVTLGWGVDDTDTWIRTLEREARGRDGRPLECLNAGHLMYNTVQEADWLEAHAAGLQPEVVVLTFVSNDVEDDHWALYQEIVEAQARTDQAQSEPLGQKLTRLWAENLPGTRRLWLFARERMGARHHQAEQVVVEDIPGYRAGWARSEAALERARREAERLGARFVVFDHSTPRIDAVREWCEEHGVPWFDFTFTPSEWARDVRVSKADSHANPLGNRYLFQKAWRALAELDLLEEAPDFEAIAVAPSDTEPR